VELGKKLLILVATSGDTGKAALEGFKDVPGISVACFFPDQGVSKAQEAQMRSTDGCNTFVYGVKGNFDDCQNGVKAIFNDADLNRDLSDAGWRLSSANSINWGRLCPQIVYYFHAYLSLARRRQIKTGEAINFVVPTGNFGNILSAWYAREMGLPVGKLICASNENRVLTDFFETGLYDRPREFYKTSSPSMDILISSNLERFLFEMNGRDPARIRAYMDELGSRGIYSFDSVLIKKIGCFLWAGSATEREAADELRGVFEEKRYLMDTHTAVGAAVYRKYMERSKDDTFTVLDATASPYKFSKSVMDALEGASQDEDEDEDELAIAGRLASLTGTDAHQALAGLDKRPILHSSTIDRGELESVVREICGK
jgi:threonine synthase